jgi:hypothetical protein
VTVFSNPLANGSGIVVENIYSCNATYRRAPLQPIDWNNNCVPGTHIAFALSATGFRRRRRLSPDSSRTSTFA